MKIKNILPIILSLGGLIIGYTVCAAPVYQTAVIADCSMLSNCPLMNGDVLLNDKISRSALPINNGMLFLGLNTKAKITSLTKSLQGFYLIKGTLGLQVWETRPRNAYQIQSGNLKLYIRQSGYYRMDVSENGRETVIRVVKGRAEIRIKNIVKVIRDGEVFRYTDNMFPNYRIINLPIYDDYYYFSINFINSYYRKYPSGAPSAISVISPYINGPRVEIFYTQPITIYNQPITIDNQPIIIREPRYRRSRPIINIDVNLRSVFGDRRSENRERIDPRTRSVNTPSAPFEPKKIIPRSDNIIPEPALSPAPRKKLQAEPVVPATQLESQTVPVPPVPEPQVPEPQIVPEPQMPEPQPEPQPVPVPEPQALPEPQVVPPVPEPQMPEPQMPEPQMPEPQMPEPQPVPEPQIVPDPQVVPTPESVVREPEPEPEPEPDLQATPKAKENHEDPLSTQP